ncbi:hypothetical protein BJX64DRAFT_192336 [Aspergillus heterothallicus]
MDIIENPYLPTEIILLIAIYGPPRDQILLIEAFPGLDRLFTSAHFASIDSYGNIILHLQALARTTEKCQRSYYRSPDIPFFPGIIASTNGAALHPLNKKGETPLICATRAHNMRSCGF